MLCTGFYVTFDRIKYFNAVAISFGELYATMRDFMDCNRTWLLTILCEFHWVNTRVFVCVCVCLCLLNINGWKNFTYALQMHIHIHIRTSFEYEQLMEKTNNSPTLKNPIWFENKINFLSFSANKFSSHITRTASWLPPAECWTHNIEYPYGWEKAIDGKGRPYYVK